MFRALWVWGLGFRFSLSGFEDLVVVLVFRALWVWGLGFRFRLSGFEDL